MRTSIYALLLAALFTSCTATENQKKQDKTEPVSTTVRLLEGDMPDPSVVRVGNTYYMVHSSFVIHLHSRTSGIQFKKSCRLDSLLGSITRIYR